MSERPSSLKYFNLRFTLLAYALQELGRDALPAKADASSHRRVPERTHWLSRRYSATTTIGEPREYATVIVLIHHLAMANGVDVKTTNAARTRRTPLYHPSLRRVCRLPTTRVDVRITARQTRETLPSKRPDARTTETGYAALL